MSAPADTGKKTEKAEKRARPAQLSEKDRADIARIETYLNSMKGISAGFLQISDSGDFRHGRIAIKRPGKMRVVYDPPEPDIIVADGTFLHMWDAGLGQQTNVLQGDNVAEFVLRENVKMSGDVTVTKLARFPAKLEVSLMSTKDPEDGELTLIFEDKPLRLRQWRVVDAQGRMTGINLENVSEETDFPYGTFSFTPPEDKKSRK